MSDYNGTKFVLNNQPCVPNAALRLLQRELAGNRSGAGVHTTRGFSECLVPTHKVLQSEAPELHIGKYTADGTGLVCFSLQLDSVVLCDYLGPVPQKASAPALAAGEGEQKHPTFHSFFRERWRLHLCHEPQQLCRDFCVSLRKGRFLLLASCTPQHARQGAAAAAAAAAGGGDPAAAAAAEAAGRAVQQPQQQGAAATDAGQVPAEQQPVSRPPSSDCCDLTTFHVVDVQQRVKVDQRSFPMDHFDLSGNACISLHDNLIAITSIRRQTIHLLQVNSNGTLTDVQQVGPQCLPDDSEPVEQAAAAEQQWQLQRQRERQQRHYWMHQQARALLPLKHCPPTAVRQQPASQQHQQQQQQQGQALLQVGQQPPVAAAAAADRRVTGHVRRRDTSGSDGMSAAGVQQQQQDSDDEDDEGMDERRVRRRHNTPQAHQQQQQQRQQPAAAHQALQQAPLLLQPPPQQQQQQQEDNAQHRAGAARHQAAAAAAAIGDGGAAAAEAATSAALLDPGGQLITGLRQRLLAHLYKAVSSDMPCDVAPTRRDFQYNFGVLSNLMVWRARLLGRQQLLLKVGAPTSGTAAAADTNPNRVHFFGVYDISSTRFTGFWKAGSARLLSAVLDPQNRLLAASSDLSPQERCCAAALYPPGFPIGLENIQQQPQQAQPQQQQQQQVGTPAAAQQPQQPPGSTAVGSRRNGGAVTAAAAAAAAAGLRRSGAAAAATGGAVRNNGAVVAGSHGPAAAGGAVQQARTGVAAAAAATTTASARGAPAEPQPVGGNNSSGHNRSSAAGGVAQAGNNNQGSSSSRSARERLKFLRQVVLMVLPGLQSLSPSPYLDPHLFRYSRHLSPIIGLRNSPAQPIRFQLARHYPGFNPAVQQEDVDDASRHDLSRAGAAATASGGADGSGSSNAGVQAQSAAAGQQQQQRQQQPAGQQLAATDMLTLDVTLSPTVLQGAEEVVRRQLHLFHPSDPFVLVVVQTPGQPATLNIYCRM